MKRSSLALLTLPSLALAVAACATLRGGDDADELYRRGLDALARGDHATAMTPLDHASRSGTGETAKRAAILLALAQMDPANPARPATPADGLAERVATGDTPTFESVVASTLARVSRESLDLREGLTSAQAQRDAAYSTIDELRARADSLTVERDTARRRMAQLEETAAECAKELEKKTQEIERIRRAIRR